MARQFDIGFWNAFMGRDLPKADAQPARPVMIEQGRAKLNGRWIKARLGDDAAVRLRVDGGRIALCDDPEGARADDGMCELPLPPEAAALLPTRDPVHGMIVQDGEALLLMPIHIEEHGPDVLGPRIIDELSNAKVVRHVVKGFGLEEWTAERLREFEDLVCTEPLAHDPLPEIASGDDWVGWKTRGKITGQPAAGDDALRQSLEDRIFGGQEENGSWDDSVVTTAFCILRARSVSVPPGDPRLRRAAQWLLHWPEPVDRPGMWMTTTEYLREWNAIKGGEETTDKDAYFWDIEDGWEHDLYRGEEKNQVIPTCCRNYPAMCGSRMLHPAATVAAALGACGYDDHPRHNDYCNTMLGIEHMFGYFCSCWGMVNYERTMEDRGGAAPDFDAQREQYEIALKALPYGYGRDAEDLLALANRPNYPDTHRPDLSDTNGWVPYEWRDIGVQNHFALVGTYWQNADCWAKTNRALSTNAAWPGTIQEFFAPFLMRLYQTPLGEFDQGYPAGLFRLLSEATRQSRQQHGPDGTPTLRFAKSILLRSVPWLRANQEDDGLWHHDRLPYWGRGDLNRPPSARLATYHIVDVLREFGLLEALRPSV